MIAIVRDVSGNYLRAVVDPRSGKILQILGPALEAQVEPGTSAMMAELLETTLPDADIAGFRGRGVVPGGEQVRRDARNEAIEQTITVPGTYRPLAGAQQQNRGGTVETFVGGPDGTGIQVFESVVETPRSAGDDAESILVTVGYAIPTADPSAILTTPIWINGNITWGTGGAHYQATFDWLKGTSFQVAASFVRIGAQVNGVVGGALQTLTLKASLAYGGKAEKSHPLRFTENLGIILAAGVSTNRVIPPFATAMTLVASGTPAFRIDVVDAIPVVRRVQYQVTDNSNLATQADGQFPLPAWARYYFVTNTGVVGNTPEVIFNLSI